MAIASILVSLVVGCGCGFAVGRVARRPRPRRVAPDVRREICASFVAAVERWLAPLAGAPLTASDRRGLEVRRDEAHLAFARLELVVSERVRLGARLWMDEVAAAHACATDTDVGPSAAIAAARPLIDRAWSHRHEFYTLVRGELGAGRHPGVRARVG